MTERQKFALENHCRFAFETANRQFARPAGDRFSVIVTVNSGWE